MAFKQPKPRGHSSIRMITDAISGKRRSKIRKQPPKQHVISAPFETEHTGHVVIDNDSELGKCNRFRVMGRLVRLIVLSRCEWTTTSMGGSCD